MCIYRCIYTESMTTSQKKIAPTDEQVAAFNAILSTRATRSRISSMLSSGIICRDGMLIAPCDCRVNPRTFATGCNH